MQNGHSDPEALLSQLRSEVRKRKLALEPSTSPGQISQPEVNPPVSSIPETVPPAEVTQALVVQAWEKPRLKRARGAIDRASIKNESVRRWPRFLRGIRRNQGAVNESLIRGINAVLETLEWFHRRFAALDSRLANQDSRSEEQQRHLVEFRRVLELRARQIAEQEERTEQHSQQLAELDQKVEGRRLEAARQEERTEQHSQQLAELDQKVEERTKQHRQQLEALDRRLEEQARRAVEAEQLAARQGQQLAELERDVEDRRLEASKEEKRVTEQHRLLGEQQRQLLELSYKLVAYQTDIGARFERAAAQQLSDKRQLVEVKSFIREQEKQTIEEHRQLSEVARRLAEHQEIANARWQKRAEQRQEDGRRLSELQEFVNAQHRQNAEDSRLLEEQQGQLAKVRETLEQSSQRLEGTAERVLLHDQTLKEMQTFVTAQQEQTAEEQRQFSDLQEFVRQQQDQTAEEQRQFSDLQAFVRQQQEQTAEEQRQFTEQRKQLEEFSRQLVEYQNDVCARYHLTGEEIEQQKRQLADMQEFVNAQHRQNAEDSRLLEEQQGQLAKVRETLEQSSQRLEETAERVLLHDQTLKEMQTFVTAQQEQTAEEQHQFSDLQEFVRQQQEQTAEEQRQFTEQRKQLEEFSRQLVEYQNDVCARYHLTGEDIEQQKRQLADMQEFVRAQEKQTREEERQLQEQQTHLAEIRGGLEEWRNAPAPSSTLAAEVGNLRDKINAVQSAFAIIQGHLSKAESPERIKTIAPSLSDELAKHEADAFYLAFENQFRGDREEIKQRLRFYLTIIEQTKAITGTALALDVGCGRGEWLELLREHGYDGVGVDLNLCMVEECRSRGLKAEGTDAISYLRDLPSGSLSLVTGFHIVEHLSFTQLFELFRETLRVLCPRGCAIFETPNPECARVPAYSFYLDPTHRNPIPHELLSFGARQAGFGATRIERLQAYFEEGKLVGYLDYAGIFTK